LDGSTVGYISETSLDAIGVVIGDVVAEEPAKVVLAQDDHVIDELALAGARSSLLVPFCFQDNEGLPPSRPETGERDPKCAIEWCQSRLRFPLIVDGKLLAKGELNERLLAVATEEGRNASHDECQEMEWGPHGGPDIGVLGAAIRG
jgi:hypothetical protein